MKNTIKWCAPRFNTNRMVADYTRKFYHAADVKWNELTGDDMQRVKDLAAWKSATRQAWQDLEILNVDVQDVQGQTVGSDRSEPAELHVGSELQIQAQIHLGRLNPDDIAVQIYHGHVDAAGKIEDGQVAEMTYVEDSLNADRAATFTGTIPCRVSGRHGFALRIVPRHPDLVEGYEPGMVLWESNG